MVGVHITQAHVATDWQVVHVVLEFQHAVNAMVCLTHRCGVGTCVVVFFAIQSESTCVAVNVVSVGDGCVVWHQPCCRCTGWNTHTFAIAREQGHQVSTVHTSGQCRHGVNVRANTAAIFSGLIAKQFARNTTHQFQLVGHHVPAQINLCCVNAVVGVHLAHANQAGVACGCGIGSTSTCCRACQETQTACAKLGDIQIAIRDGRTAIVVTEIKRVTVDVVGIQSGGHLNRISVRVGRTADHGVQFQIFIDVVLNVDSRLFESRRQFIQT